MALTKSLQQLLGLRTLELDKRTRMKLRTRRALCVACCTFLVVNIWLHLRLVTTDRYMSMLPAHELIRRDDPFGSRVQQTCDVRFPKEKHFTTDIRMLDVNVSDNRSKGMCFSSIRSRTDIQTDDIWSSVSVEYPRYVLTVTGWVDTISVDRWTKKPLHVFVVPFSHQDPGWIKTYEGYYNQFTNKTIGLIVTNLSANQRLRFIWPEVTYLSKWWKDASLEMKTNFTNLVKTGRLEIPTGGWVMPDESTAHYSAMLDQLIEGHVWLEDNLGFHPNTSWAIDPFGHSATMAYLLGKAGINDILIQRTHFAVKRQFAAANQLEFLWKQAWDDTGSANVFCHMMPFLLYSIPHSCGPERDVCCQFDFYKKSCFRGKTKVEATKVTSENVDKISEKLWEQLQKKAELYRSPVLLMPHGDDFRFSTQDEWNSQFSNLDQIMSYINSHSYMNMKIEYGTLSQYFDALKQVDKEKHVAGTPQEYPTLSGDFFPYSDRGDQYWSGFYTSRPFYKHMVRRLQAILRSAEIWFTILTVKGYRRKRPEIAQSLYEKLTEVRRAHALHQHHDAITGTSKRAVVTDYGTRLHKAITFAHEILSSVLMEMTVEDAHPSSTVDVGLNVTEEWEAHDQLPSMKVINITHARYIVVGNSLAQARKDIVNVHVDRPDVQVVLKASGRVVPHQISPVVNSDGSLGFDRYQLLFSIDLDPLSLVTYVIRQDASVRRSKMASVTVFNGGQRQFADLAFPVFKQENEKTEVTFTSATMSATFSTCDGLLKLVETFRDGGSHTADIQFLKYHTGRGRRPFQDRSGAYIFLPDGPAELLTSPTSPLIIAIEGHLQTTIHTFLPGIHHTATLDNRTDSDIVGVALDNIVDMRGEAWDNTELVMRVSTDGEDTPPEFCSDSNGFQLHKRTTRKKLTIQGNFYPMTSMAIVEGVTSRLSLITTEAHAVSSLVSGSLEVVLDRRLMQDDWRGLSEGVIDNVPTRSQFVLMFEPNTNTGTVKQNVCFPTLPAILVSRYLDNPVMPYTVHFNQDNANEVTHVQLLDYVPESLGLPCDVHLLNFRLMPFTNNTSVTSLLVLHRQGVVCSPVASRDLRCSQMSNFSLKTILPELSRATVVSTSLTGNTDRQPSTVTDDIHITPMEIASFKVCFS